MSEKVLPEGLSRRLSALVPGATVRAVKVLGVDEHAEGESAKELGYGRPIRVTLATADGAERSIVFHTAVPNDFGHDRRSDRAQGCLLAYDTFAEIPSHVRAVDVGAIRDDGALVSLERTHEFYLITDWTDGTLYADDLRRVGREGDVTPLDLARVDAIARYLAHLHSLPGTHPAAYTRAIRDTLGHGEGIFGLIDSYAPDVPGAPPETLRAIESKCLDWRWRLKHRTERLRRTHGDFHPFNLVWAKDAELVLLDASRGCEGDPADDVACIAINYLFFALEHRERFSSGLGQLWERFWERYLSLAGPSVLESLAPFFAWRALVIASPLWYPHLTRDDRARIFAFVLRALDNDRFDPAWGAEAMKHSS
ncbi:MAG: phosphotransferase [Myxococcales bacterium]|nr:phosphotransferase [Myxococcales bacterium]